MKLSICHGSDDIKYNFINKKNILRKMIFFLYLFYHKKLKRNSNIIKISIKLVYFKII